MYRACRQAEGEPDYAASGLHQEPIKGSSRIDSVAVWSEATRKKDGLRKQAVEV
jgi:hypothetical protein